MSGVWIRLGRQMVSGEWRTPQLRKPTFTSNASADLGACENSEENSEVTSPVYRNLRATSECFVFLLLKKKKKSSLPPPPTPPQQARPYATSTLRQLLFLMAALKIASQPCRRPSWRRCLRSLGFLMLEQRANRHPNLQRFREEAHPFFYF